MGRVKVHVRSDLPSPLGHYYPDFTYGHGHWSSERLTGLSEVTKLAADRNRNRVLTRQSRGTWAAPRPCLGPLPSTVSPAPALHHVLTLTWLHRPGAGEGDTSTARKRKEGGVRCRCHTASQTTKVLGDTRRRSRHPCSAGSRLAHVTRLGQRALGRVPRDGSGENASVPIDVLHFCHRHEERLPRSSCRPLSWAQNAHTWGGVIPELRREKLRLPATPSLEQRLQAKRGRCARPTEFGVPIQLSTGDVDERLRTMAGVLQLGEGGGTTRNDALRKAKSLDTHTVPEASSIVSRFFSRKTKAWRPLLCGSLQAE
ncbi:uncharacterized protein LOC125939162 [Panthera uncia]|uniref:uncharacterized protein LOC125939162 n=1 Tax=Panthera uncia TaxID=29064 RepID=UPI0020FFA328|nr:uncharacterized protein LOC125939162 [Panthera uncia]